MRAVTIVTTATTTSKQIQKFAPRTLEKGGLKP
jgi:hypothetical protein